MRIFKVTFVFLGAILIILKLQDVVEHLLSFLLMERFKTVSRNMSVSFQSFRRLKIVKRNEVVDEIHFKIQERLSGKDSNYRTVQSE